MRKSSPIDSKVQHEGRSRRGQDDGRTLDQADHDSTNDECARLFTIAAGNFGSGKEVAFALRVDPSFVTHLRDGSKSVGLRHVLPLIAAQGEKALPIINALCDLAGVAHARPRRKVTKRESERQLLLQLRRLTGVYELVRKEAAAQLGTQEQEIDESLDDTSEIVVGQ